MIRIDAVWLAVEAVDMRAGADRLLAKVVQVFGGAQAHHGYAPHKVRVNALAPSRTRTDRLVKLFEMGHTSSALDDRHLLGWAEPLDVAQAALYLASDESLRTTGQVMRIDSGISIS